MSCSVKEHLNQNPFIDNERLNLQIWGLIRTWETNKHYFLMLKLKAVWLKLGSSWLRPSRGDILPLLFGKSHLCDSQAGLKELWKQVCANTA